MTHGRAGTRVSLRRQLPLQLWACAVGMITLAGPSHANPDAAPEPARPLVAAASDLKFALDEILAAFARETGIEPRVTYGSSGNLQRQIAHGAPYELFLSADEAFVHALADRKLTRDRGELYAIGRIALFAPHGSPLAVDPGLDGLERYLAERPAGRIAIANPEHAPYGRAAGQALRARGLWDAALPRLLYGENVAQAAQFASSGDADGGIIAHSLAASPALRQRGRYALIAPGLHAPLRQRMVLLAQASPAAERLYRYLRTPPVHAILARHGFERPEE